MDKERIVMCNTGSYVIFSRQESGVYVVRTLDGMDTQQQFVSMVWPAEGIKLYAAVMAGLMTYSWHLLQGLVSI